MSHFGAKHDNERIMRWGQQELVAEMVVEMKEQLAIRTNSHNDIQYYKQAKKEHDDLKIVCALYKRMGVKP